MAKLLAKTVENFRALDCAQNDDLPASEDA
jgi:hypothetical protein